MTLLTTKRSKILIAITIALALLGIGVVTALYSRPLKQPELVQYEDIRVGSGSPLDDGTEVTVNYILRLKDGAVLMDTHKTGQTFTFVVGAGQVLKGWEDGIRGLREGGIRRMLIPPEFAYGVLGSGKTVPPGAVLEVEIELLKIRKKSWFRLWTNGWLIYLVITSLKFLFLQE